MIETLTPAGSADSDLYFDFVNHLDCLAGMALTSGPIPRTTHEAWFKARRDDPGSLLSVIEIEGKAIGQVRLQAGDNGTYAVDIYITPEARKGGLAPAAVLGAIEELAAEQPLVRVVAIVCRDNLPSQALFRSAGFERKQDVDDLMVFERLA